MPNLKDLRIRINSVKSTQKITSAMKMVAAAKLRRAQEQAEAARPYSERMERMLKSLAEGQPTDSGGPGLLAGTGKDETHLLLVMSSDRGLCGGFNTSIVREARAQIRLLQADGKQVKLFCVGRKGRDVLRREHASLIIDTFEDVGRRTLGFVDAEAISSRVLQMFDKGEFDVCTVIYNHFRSAISQIVTTQQFIPFSVVTDNPRNEEVENLVPESQRAVYEFEPDEQEILEILLPRNLAVQVYHSLLENSASEHGARMTAMDSATRNAGDMIDGLTMTYNRTRQAFITKELIEIISGAEAL